MPIREMCAECAKPCDCTAIVFKQRSPAPDFSQALVEQLPGHYCAPAAWRMVFHTLRTRGAEYVGGDVLPR